MGERAGDAPSGQALASARARLQRVWGYPAFRAGQDEVIEAVLAGRDTLAIMPTGGGKSLCYQLPALERDGLTLVVSPLIALMQDQVAALRGLGIEAGALCSANDAQENAAVYTALRERRLKLLYIAPERLALPDTAAMLSRADLRLLAVDEAHCVAQWGHDFRPDYLAIGAFRDSIAASGRDLQVAAFTATADEATRAEIIAKLFRNEPRIFIRGFDRPNLRLAFAPKKSPRKQLLDFIKAREGQAGIVYCASRKGVERTAEALCEAGIHALPYHAGLEPERRTRHQKAFVEQDGVVMTATIAFGMGVDKPDVRWVAHLDLPKTVESYYQEIGRAGRDGLPADTLTLYGFEDMKLRRRQIDESEAPENRKRADHARLNALLALAEAPVCRRQTLLAYFDETCAPCGNCDLCEEPPERFDGTIAAQKALSAMLRTGENFGVEHLITVLLGDESANIRKFGHHNLKTFGCGKEFSKNDWRGIFRQLYALGFADVAVAEFGQWRVSEAGWRVLKGEEPVALRKDAIGRKDAASRKSRPLRGAAIEGEADNALLAALKDQRRELAQKNNVPAYVIFSDRTLTEIAIAKPRSELELASCHGVGEAKIKRYGQWVLEIVERAANAA
ncbi:MAG: DNA helicase RecQ [Neomegalonema sp.]|nr:DNA helicase RecQ [Neomegalonema sp.]